MTRGAQQERDARPLREGHQDRLDGLADALVRHGLRATMATPPGRMPSLHVVHPGAGAGAGEDIYAGCCQDGVWWFWWPWAERIAAESDLEGAAAAIEAALAAPRHAELP